MDSAAAGKRGAVTALLADTLDRLAQAAPSFSAAPGEERPSQAEATASPDQATGPRATLGALLDDLDERAFGLMLLLLALPCCVPFLWGIPQIVALPMLALAGQLAAGRQDPWLPTVLRTRDFNIDDMRSVVSRVERYLGWLERFAARRLEGLTHGRGAQIIGALLLIPTASILVPLPSTNTIPGIGVAIAAVGFLERDGLLVLLGLVIGLLWVALLLFVGVEAISLLKDMILGAD